ncbi:MAG TPA: hypothetical protein VLU99_01115 [Nitrososphaerales archaeon]|nr:hypothetical protein [Nitrososphaerales archaeon]HUK74361.1 hypothetical protein [Nitrososphaerales archaeon]
MTDESSYAASFLEGSLGLEQGSLGPGAVPSALAGEIASVMRGAPPKDSTTPSLEVAIRAFLSELEKSALEENGFIVRKARWPGSASFAVCLTHDVDNIERPADHVAKVKDRFSASDYAKWKRGELSLYDNIEMIREKEAAAGFRSSFYLMSAEYPLSKVRKAARALDSRGWEVGLHGDFGTHDSEREMARAVERLADGLGVHPRGVREHYLRFDFQKTWKVMDGAGFDYDTTVGNADAIGFKMGLATPFHPPDQGWAPMRLLELPLSLMDTTLWGYLKRGEEEGLEDVRRTMKMVEDVKGLYTLLWHQEAVRMKGGRQYWAVLKELARRKRVFVGSGADVAGWWRAREVPLRSSAGGRLITLGGKPPKGLRLVVKAREGTKLRVVSGSARETRPGMFVVSPEGGKFRMEVTKVGGPG